MHRKGIQSSMNGCEEEVLGQDFSEQLPLRQDAEKDKQDTFQTCSNTDQSNGAARMGHYEETSDATEEEDQHSSQETRDDSETQTRSGRKVVSDGWFESETARAMLREESIPQLFVSILTGSVREVQSLLEQQPLVVNNPKHGGQAPIHAACHNQNIDILRVLLDYGAKVASVDALGSTPLHLAVNDAWHVGVMELLNRGASPNAKSVPPATIKEVVVETPLHAAVRRRDMTSVTLMMQHEPDLSILDGNSCSMLHLAAQTRNLELVKKLITEPTLAKECNSKDRNGQTVLHAVFSDKCDEDPELLTIELIKILRKFATDVNITNYAGETPLFLASRYGLSQVVKLLLSLESDPTILTNLRQSVLHAACLAGSSDTLSILLQRDDLGNLVTIADNDNCRPFDYAVKSWSVRCCYLLLINGEHLANTKDGVTNCELMLEHLPSASQVLERLFDSHVHLSEKSRHDPDFSITFDYSALLSEEKNTIQCSVVSELVHSPFEDLIKHPLLESFLYVKWCRLQRYFYAGVLLYFAFLILHTSFVVLTFGSSPIDWSEYNSLLWSFLAGHIILYVVLLFPIVVMIIANFRKYIRQVETLIRFVTFLSSAVVAFSPNLHYGAMEEIKKSRNISSLNDSSASTAFPSHVPMTAERQMAAVSVFFVWVEFMMLLGRYPMLGTYILMLSGVAKSMIKLLASFVFLLVGFTFSFHILFQELPVFETLSLSFVKTMMMMSGEIAYSEFVLAMDVPFSGLVLLSLYLFMVAVLLANLLIGLAVNDIPSLQQRGRIHRLAKEASYLVAFEKLLLTLKRRTSIPRRLLRLVSGRCKIKTKVEIFPNRKETLITRENIREAVNLGNPDVPQEENYSFEEEKTSSSYLKGIQKQHLEDVNELKTRIDELVKCYKSTQQQLSLMHQLLNTHTSQLSLQLQQIMQEIHGQAFQENRRVIHSDSP